MAEASYLDALNPEQREAVLTLQGPVLIVAGAGSGKTRVLTYRIAHFLQQGVAPYSILALTFTNKAAREMKERIQKVVGGDVAERLYMGTFHSIFMRILREEAATLGYSSNFTIYDTGTSVALVNRIIKKKQLDKEVYKARDIFSIISRYKNDLVLPADYLADRKLQERDVRSNHGRLGEIYEEYCQEMAQNNAMDFDDLLVNTFRLFNEHRDILERYQNIFKYIMVDEFQDTNDVQNRILNLLAQRHHNLCVVGDDAQSIYAFRGARVQNILQFTTLYPEAKTIKLITNYRSTSAIVNAANLLISYNPNQIHKECRAAQEAGKDIKVLVPETDSEEALLVAKEISEISMRSFVPYNHFAVLYRTSAQSRSLEVALRRYNIPCRIYGGTSFYTRKEIMDLMAYFNFVINPSDNDMLMRIINLPTRGIGDKAQNTLFTEALRHRTSIWNYIESLPRKDSDLQKGAQTALCLFREMLQPFIVEVSTAKATDFAKKLYHTSGLQGLYEADGSAEGEARIQNLRELFIAIADYEEEYKKAKPLETVTLGMFMEEAALLTDADQKDKENANSVTLTTIHSAKGLEFEHVYVVGLEDGLFPSQRSLAEDDGEEEERRLCYVAVTRAAKTLTVSSCRSRRTYSAIPSMAKPSRFLLELLGKEKYIALFRRGSYADSGREASFSEESLVRFRRPPSKGGQSSVNQLEPQRERRKVATGNLASNLRRSLSPTKGSTTQSAPVTPFTDFAVGDSISHASLGEGTIRSLQGAGYDMRALIEFADGSVRTLTLKYAKLKKLN